MGGDQGEDQAGREISATELNMLPCVYPWSINVVVYHDPSGKTQSFLNLVYCLSDFGAIVFDVSLNAFRLDIVKLDRLHLNDFLVYARDSRSPVFDPI
jgi:hypothetical protein